MSEGTRPKNWLVESILVTLFCCLPLPIGVVGIINAAKVNSAFDAGRVDEAIKASEDAKKWTKIGFIIGLVISVLYGILMMLGVAGGIMGGAAGMDM